MKKKKDYLTEYNKLCREAGLTYAQMQQQETMRRMQRIHIPEGYKKSQDTIRGSGEPISPDAK